MEKTARVNWEISADIECPYCEEYSDFMEIDEWYHFCEVGENKNFDMDFECQHCKKEFKLTGSDH